MVPGCLALAAASYFTTAAAGRALQQGQRAPVNVNSAQELKHAVQSGHAHIHFQSNVTASKEHFPELSLDCIPDKDVEDPVAFIEACQPDMVFYEPLDVGDSSAVWTADPDAVFDVRFLQRSILVGKPLELQGVTLAQYYDDRYPYFYFFGTYADGSLLVTDSLVYSPCGLGDPRYIEDGIVTRLSVKSYHTVDDAAKRIYFEQIGPIALVDSIGDCEIVFRNTTMQCYDYRTLSFAGREVPASWVTGADTTVVNPDDVCQRRVTIGEDYRGTMNTTATGLPCQYWNTTAPQYHSRAPSRLPEYGLGESDQNAHNYCRNPDNMEEGVWCYIASERFGDQFKRWEYCDVPVCTEAQEQSLIIMAAPPREQASESGGGSRLGTSGIVIICVVSLLLLALAALLLVFRRRLHRCSCRASPAEPPAPKSDVEASPRLPVPMVSLQVGLASNPTTVCTKPSYPDVEMTRAHFSTMTAHDEMRGSTNTTLSAMRTTFSWPSSAPLEATKLTKGGQSKEYSLAVEALQDALDDMHDQEQLLLQRWSILDAVHRRVGGQGVVQFIRDTQSNEEACCKFFLDGVAFQREAELYNKPEVREMMAAVVCLEDNADGALTTTNGFTLPPFIILERGRSLNEWALITRPDYVTSLQVMVQIVDRLNSLHACGVVHRDIKPANIVWRSSVGQWTLIDFGCATTHGRVAGIACSMPYAAPEVGQALKEGHWSMAAHTAMDVWALAIVIWELFSGLRAFPESNTADIIDALTSSAPLPWESGGAHSNSMKKLGLVKRVVKVCLSRDPSKRPSAQMLLATLDSLLCSATSMAQSGQPD